MSEVSGAAEQTAGLAGTGQAGLSRMEATMQHVMDAAGSVNASWPHSTRRPATSTRW